MLDCEFAEICEDSISNPIEIVNEKPKAFYFVGSDIEMAEFTIDTLVTQTNDGFDYNYKIVKHENNYYVIVK